MHSWNLASIQQAFSKPSLVNLISKDTHLVFSIFLCCKLILQSIDKTSLDFYSIAVKQANLSIQRIPMIRQFCTLYFHSRKIAILARISASYSLNLFSDIYLPINPAIPIGGSDREEGWNDWCINVKWNLFPYEMCNNTVYKLINCLAVLLSPVFSWIKCYLINGINLSKFVTTHFVKLIKVLGCAYKCCLLIGPVKQKIIA